MTTLHIINKSPFERNSLDTCLRLAKPGSAILLIEDGIYAARKNTAVGDKVAAATGQHSLYALAPDLNARGIGKDELVDGISLVDYEGFVQLTTEHAVVQSWL